MSSQTRPYAKHARPTKYRQERSATKTQARKELSEHFSSSDEVPLVFPMSYSDKHYAGELLVTNNGILELGDNYEKWIPTIPVISLDELCRERESFFAVREGHLVTICKKQKEPWGFQIRALTNHHDYAPENKLDVAADRILMLAGLADELTIRA